MRTRLGKDGMLTVEDQTKDESKGQKRISVIDPSTIPGYYGTFRCKPPQGRDSCDVLTMDMTEQGDFAFDFGTNADILEKSGIS